MNDLDLRTALHRDADLVGEPAPDLLDQLRRRRQQQHRQRIGVGGALLAVVVIAAGIPLGGALLGGAEGGLATDPTPTVSTEAPSPSPELPSPSPSPSPEPSPEPTPPSPEPVTPVPVPAPVTPSTEAEVPAGGAAAVVLGPEGLGSLRLGMSREQAETTGLVEPFRDEYPGETCSWRAALAGAPAGEALVLHSENLGVATIDAYPGVRTPEGVGIGSSLAAVQDAYPSFQLHGEFGRGQVGVPGSDRAVYRIAFVDGAVAELTLQYFDQDCYE
ncbi:hypothetical protein [uncultured Modestobacter sp.]|uniref:hypothetical protein n=1 Tax=uncultured Modestobacter sp. TaxID=380048 RepID=UPI002605FA82|nr:hypothetical protein [uncultured Modestobacter sp.]